jgi:glycerol-3-phosphate acyltransferase PlsY
MIIAKFFAVVIMGYILGSIPFGLIISRRRAKVDVRQYGSGKTGATNVLRTAGSKAAALVAILDVLKGVLAVIFAGLIIGGDYLVVGNFSLGLLVAEVMAALAAVAGHIWPLFLKFRGGRGVATFIGGLVVLCPPAAIIGGEVMIIGAGLTRYVSLGSIAGTVSTYAILIPLHILNRFPIEYLAYALIGTILVIYMHRDNITRLVSGKERRLGEKVKNEPLNPPLPPQSSSFQEPYSHTQR